MAQITGFDSARNAKIEFSTDGSSWTDISGAANTLVPSGGARQTGETYTFSGDNPIVTVGKSTPVDIACTFVYTEGSSDAFRTLLPVWENGSSVYVRWWPFGGQTGELGFTAGPGKLTAFSYPPATANDGGAVMSGFTYHGPKPSMSVAA